jgi:hypothetical protein
MPSPAADEEGIFSTTTQRVSHAIEESIDHRDSDGDK